MHVRAERNQRRQASTTDPDLRSLDFTGVRVNPITAAFVAPDDASERVAVNGAAVISLMARNDRFPPGSCMSLGAEVDNSSEVFDWSKSYKVVFTDAPKAMCPRRGDPPTGRSCARRVARSGVSVLSRQRQLLR